MYHHIQSNQTSSNKTRCAQKYILSYFFILRETALNGSLSSVLKYLFFCYNIIGGEIYEPSRRR